MNSSTRNFLRKSAHGLKPVVMIGQHGLSDSVVAACEQALSSHELIKIKYQDFKAEKQTISRELAEKTDAQVVSVLGNMLILYRPDPDPAKRRYSAET